MDRPSLNCCLAYAAITKYPAWLGRPSVQDLQLLLIGAATRAELLGAEIPQWRIFGPLEQPEFYLPLVGRTGHPKLSIKWATALELIYFNQEDAFAELRSLLEEWERLPDNSSALPFVWPPGGHRDLSSYLGALACRPGMYLGSNDGWALRCLLHGMASGGDWLSLPALPALGEVIRGIEAQSRECYGSSFAAYRVCEATELLAWAGIDAEGVDSGLAQQAVAADRPKKGAG